MSFGADKLNNFGVDKLKYLGVDKLKKRELSIPKLEIGKLKIPKLKMTKLKKPELSKRVWEIDFLRGLALVLMVYFHVIYDMNEIYGYNINYESGLNRLAGRTAGILFILISGVSCELSRNNLKRGLKILGFGLAITLFTYLAYPSFAILFGILHLIGTSIILYSLLLSKAKWSVQAAAGIAIIASKALVNKVSVMHDFLFFIGIYSPRFSSADYYPLVPWFGFFLLGAAAGKLLYKDKRSLLTETYRDNIINMAGRHTLLVYLVHQPIIILFLEVISRL
jgi:uncharacterized membrane protein